MSNEDQAPAPVRFGGYFRKRAAEPGQGLHHVDRSTGELSLRPFLGAEFADERGRTTVDGDPTAGPYPPFPLLRLSTNYVANEPWIELVNVKAVTVPSGPADNPWNGQQPPHTFLRCDEVVLHMLSGDFRYRVTHQPGKYAGAEHVNGAEHTATDVAGDPNTHVDWFYDLDLIEE